MLYYATRISENISRRDPEGYLICRHVPIARTGTQQYEPSEIGQSGTDLIRVERPEDEVFSVATIASFEGMPVTDDHPSEDSVDAQNISYLQKGHVQNVHRGTGKESNLLIADLMITDPFTIDKVLNGKREISCGYNYEMEEENGHFIQRAIRGNHIAIVDRGRAGHRVAIQDSARPKTERRPTTMDKKLNLMSRMFASFAKDEDVDKEELAKATDEMQEIAATAAPVAPPPTPQQTAPASAATVAGAIAGTKTEDEAPVPPAAAPAPQPDKLDKVISLLQQLLAAKSTDEAPAAEENPLDKLVKDLDGAEEKPEQENPFPATDSEDDPSDPESKFVDPEQMNNDADPEDAGKACDAATLRIAVDAIKPIIAMLPENKRKAATDAAVRTLRSAAGKDAAPAKNAYMDVIKASKRQSKDSAAEDPSALGQKIMASRNVNFKK